MGFKAKVKEKIVKYFFSTKAGTLDTLQEKIKVAKIVPLVFLVSWKGIISMIESEIKNLEMIEIPYKIRAWTVKNNEAKVII